MNTFNNESVSNDKALLSVGIILRILDVSVQGFQSAVHAVLALTFVKDLTTQNV